MFHSPQWVLIATTSPGEMISSRPAAAKTVSIFATRLVSGELLRASIYATTGFFVAAFIVASCGISVPTRAAPACQRRERKMVRL